MQSALARPRCVDGVSGAFFNTFQYNKQADLDALDLKKKNITAQTAAAPIAHRFLRVSSAGLKWDMTHRNAGFIFGKML